MVMSQIGSEVVQQGAPKFANYVVVAGTWKEKDTTDMQRTDDGDSEVYNYSFWKAGVDATCDLIIKADQSRLAKGSVLSESSPGTRAFVVIDVETSDFGGMPLKQSVTLAYHNDFTPTVVT